MLPGTTIGRYEILRLLAAGGMGEVYLARQHSTVPGFATLVVIKMLIKTLSTNPSFVQMFLEEARIVGKLRHKNVVQVHDVARHGDQFYMVMEYIPGQNLRELLGDATILDRPLFAPRLGAEIFADLASALAAAHAERMVHRDISPNNLMIGDEGIAKLIDFGVARALSSTSLTKPGTLKGKFSYMAPEYVRSQAYDHRIDLFSLGVVMWETFARRRLFRGPSAAEQLHQLLEAPIPPLDEVIPGFPRDLSTVIAAALERDPMRRISSAMLLADSLAEIARGLPVGPDASLRKWLENRIPGRLHDRHLTDQTLSALPHGAPIPDFGIAFPQAGSIPGTYGNHPPLLDEQALQLQAPATAPPQLRSAPPTSPRARLLPILLGFLAGVMALGGVAWLLTRSASGPATVDKARSENEQISVAEAHRELGIRALADGDLGKARHEFSEALRLGAGAEVRKLLELTAEAPAIEAPDAGPAAPVAPVAPVAQQVVAPPSAPSIDATGASRRAAARSPRRTTDPAPETPPLSPPTSSAPLEGEPLARPPTGQDQGAVPGAETGATPVAAVSPSELTGPTIAAPSKPSAPPASPPVRTAPPLARTPRVSTDGSPDAGAGVVRACNSCHAKTGARPVSGRRYTRAQWERFFATGQHDRYVGIGDQMGAGQLQAARAFLRASAADSAEHQGAGIQE